MRDDVFRSGRLDKNLFVRPEINRSHRQYRPFGNFIFFQQACHLPKAPRLVAMQKIVQPLRKMSFFRIVHRQDRVAEFRFFKYRNQRRLADHFHQCSSNLVGAAELPRRKTVLRHFFHFFHLVFLGDFQHLRTGESLGITRQKPRFGGLQSFPVHPVVSPSSASNVVDLLLSL